MTDEDVELVTCDGCGEETPSDDLRLHEDGNWYCEECDYLTEQDRLDAAADDLFHSMREDGEL